MVTFVARSPRRPSTHAAGVSASCSHDAKRPASLVITRGAGLIQCDSDLVELGGIEPPSNAESPRLLRAQSVEAFCSAPTFVTDT